MKSLKTRIAAIATVVGLGGLTGLALSAGSQKSAPVAVKPLVRTKVIRRTIHVTKHAKPKHPMSAGAAGTAATPGLFGRLRRGLLRQRHHRCVLERLLAVLSLFVFLLEPGHDFDQRRLAAVTRAPAATPVVTHTSGSAKAGRRGHPQGS